MNIGVPIDFETTGPFVRLVQQTQDVDKATGIYLRLFQRLGYALREGRALGFVEPEDVGLFEARVGCRMDKLAEAGLVSARDGNRYYCPAFAQENAAHNLSSKGGRSKNYDARVENRLKAMAGETLLISADKLVDAAGAPLAPEVIDRMRRLVICCDSALGKLHRGPWQYSATLVQNALRVLERYHDDQINAVCRQIAMKKDHPYLAGVETERLLAPVGEGGRAMFDEVLEKLGLS